MEKTYEDLITELRELVRKIEDPDTSLDESMSLYERGAVLIKKCEEILDRAEMKVTELGRD
ncbi:MAG: exodeoxyribonuclease VII small subunit [Methanoregulaceae archaeon]|nr:exodeoxyribonuclease VII small subunit [Methanoregulaceae archaeon]